MLLANTDKKGNQTPFIKQEAEQGKGLRQLWGLISPFDVFHPCVLHLAVHVFLTFPVAVIKYPPKAT